MSDKVEYEKLDKEVKITVEDFYDVLNKRGVPFLEVLYKQFVK